MASLKPGPDRSSSHGVLGQNGSIDLSGGALPSRQSQRPTLRATGDAWVVDRDRRTLVPPTRELVVEEPPEESVTDDIHAEIADRFALGDYAAALSAAELQLGLDPDDESARQYAQISRERLEARYTTRIGSLDFVYDLAVPAAQVKWLGLDPQASFLLSLLDGQTTVAEALKLCQMGRLEGLRVFTELLEAKAIARVA